MTGLDQQLRDYIDQSTPPVTIDEARLARRHEPRRHRHSRGVAIAAAILIVAAVSGVIVWRHHDTASTGKVATTGGQHLAEHVGEQAVSYSGLTIWVPATWAVARTLCHPPAPPVVTIQTTIDMTSCPPMSSSPPPPGPTMYLGIYGPTELIVKKNTPPNTGTPLDKIATRTVTIDGHAARRGSTTAASYGATDVAPGWHVSVLIVDDLSVVVTLIGPDLRDDERILDATEVHDTDRNGCTATAFPAHPLPTGPAPDRLPTMIGGIATFVPPAPVKATVCRYLGQTLVSSATLDPTDTVQLATELNALPDYQVLGAVFCQMITAQDTALRYELHLTTSEGRTVTVSEQPGQCAWPAYTSAGAWRGHGDTSLLRWLDAKVP